MGMQDFREMCCKGAIDVISYTVHERPGMKYLEASALQDAGSCQASQPSSNDSNAHHKV